MTRINTLALAVLLLGCAPRPTAYPISSSHSQLTASDYDLAEAAFSGGLATLLPKDADPTEKTRVAIQAVKTWKK